MPKIVINEYDNTTAGVGNYQNFSVLVPGFVGKSVEEGVFDDNGVFECSDAKEFIDKIGKKITKWKVEPVRPTFTRMSFDPEIEAEVTDFNAKKAAKTLYDIDDEVFEEDGYLHTKNEEFELTEDTLPEKDKEYAFIEKGKEGVDGKTESHYGNQIAYELLKLGYTVLFKKISAVSDLIKDDCWTELKDKASYDFRYVLTGIIDDSENARKANEKIIELADYVNADYVGIDGEGKDLSSTGRGDCIALCDISEHIYKDSNVKTQAQAIAAIQTEVSLMKSSKYAAIFAPSVDYSMPVDEAYKNTTFPASFHYLACAARALENYNEWYAIAGHTRGISKYSVNGLGFKFGEAAIDALEPRYLKIIKSLTDTKTFDKAVNLIVKMKNEIVLWGNRTAEKLDAYSETAECGLRASHFLNIRQLCCTLKKQIYVACRKFTFDPNSDVLWINFCNAIRPTLERMKADQGIADYKFIKRRSSKKALLCAKIRIVPIEAVEDFDISLTLEDSIAGIKTGIDEKEAE